MNALSGLRHSASGPAQHCSRQSAPAQAQQPALRPLHMRRSKAVALPSRWRRSGACTCRAAASGSDDKSPLADFAQQAAKAGRTAFESAQTTARKAYVKLDAEHRITEKANRATRQAEEAMRDVDQKYGVRRRLRAAIEEAQRRLPIWQQQWDEFSQTSAGKVVIFLGIVFIASSGLVWHLLNALSILYLLALPLSLLAADYLRKKTAEQAARAQEEYERQQAARNPFSSFMRDFGAGNGFGASKSGASQGRSSSRAGGAAQGPVIDAEWVSLDDDGKPRR